MERIAGTFTLAHLRFFGCESGAYTSMTAAEIRKQTYNVKSDVKQLLVSKIGEGNIPKSGDGSDGKMEFHVWPFRVGLSDNVRMGCKFSKPDKDEMSIYLSPISPKHTQDDGDVWFIFFRQGDLTPWVGFLKRNIWDHMFRDINQNETGLAITEEETELKNHYNLIVYGAPGTGKSHYIEKNIGENDHTRVTFHPEYTYYDFVGAYKPTPLYKKKEGDTTEQFKTYDGDSVELFGEPIIDYQFVPGPFVEILIDALNNSNKIYYLIIEEINRTNAAAVFGDLFQLLDRKDDGNSQYSIRPQPELLKYIKRKVRDYHRNEIYIPENLRIISTMNSADQGVNPMDTAFKRRWEFKYIPISFEQCPYRDKTIEYAKKQYKWEEFVQALNNKLSSYNIEEDKQIGPFFLKEQELGNQDKFCSKLLMYLWDDVLRERRTKLFSADIKTFNELMKRYKAGDEIFVDFQFPNSVTVEEQSTEETQSDVSDQPTVSTQENNAGETVETGANNTGDTVEAEK